MTVRCLLRLRKGHENQKHIFKFPATRCAGEASLKRGILAIAQRHVCRSVALKRLERADKSSEPQRSSMI